jgi:hypothetical protein
MLDWRHLFRLVHDNIAILFFGLVVAVFALAWLVIEAYRSHRSRDEIFKLRRRISTLERERVMATLAVPTTDPMVLTARWVRMGSAATTTDGGCLVMVDRVFPQQRRVVLTLRVDGYPALSGHSAVAGERVEVNGKYGTYILQVFSVEGIQTQLAVWLRSHHAGAVSE